MGISYAESVLASYVTYKELYSNSSYKSAYQILAEFIKYIISAEEIYSFSLPEMKKKLQDVFGFCLPSAVIKSAIKKIDCIEKIQNSIEYGVDRNAVVVDERFSQYKDAAEKENSHIADQLMQYATDHNYECSSKENLLQELVAYLLDESNGNKYQEMISAFILQNENNENIVRQLNAVREGSILYLGLNCNINEIGSMTNELTLYLDMEILFDIYGYNGKVFQALALDMISLIKDANVNGTKIKLRFFEETQREIFLFFAKASDIVRHNTILKENVAMKAIVNGCKDITDVSDRESDFYHILQYKYGIKIDNRNDYYGEDKYVANLEGLFLGEKVDADIETSLKFLSHINKLRRNQTFSDYTKCGYLFVTQTRRTLELSNRIKNEYLDDSNDEEMPICNLAVDMSFLTNILWYKMNRGFGVHNYPKNLDSVIKAKVVLSSFISQNISEKYKEFQKQFREGTLSADQMAGRLLKLREKAAKPEDLTPDNVEDNLNFNLSYLAKYEEERESQRIQLEEKAALIEEITSKRDTSFVEYEKKISKIADDLQATRITSEEQKKTILSQDVLINEQQEAIKERDKKLAEYEEKEHKKQLLKEKALRIVKFIWALIWRSAIVLLIGYIAYRFAKYVKADAANTAAIVVTVLGGVIGTVDIVKNVYHKIFQIKKKVIDN